MRIVVTGSNGLIGNFIAKKLKEHNLDVVGISKNHNIKTEFKELKCNLKENDRVVDFLNILKPDFLIHCASVIPDNFLSENDKNASIDNRKIDDVIINYITRRNKNCKLIYFSTCSLYDKKINSLDGISENSKLDIRSYYSAQKYKSEIIISENIEKYSIFRISSPYRTDIKPYKKTVLAEFINSAINGNDLYIFDGGKRLQDFIACDDIFKAVFKCILNRDINNNIYNIVDGECISMSNLASLVLKIFGNGKNEIINISTDNYYENKAFFYKNDLAFSELNWKPNKIENNLKCIRGLF